MTSPVLENLKNALLGPPAPWESFSLSSGAANSADTTMGQPFVTGTIGTSPTKLFPAYSALPAYWVIVSVRSFGASTYCRIGNPQGQVQSLLSATDSVIFAAPPGHTIDAATLTAYCSNGDVTLEVTGLYPAQPPAGLAPQT